MIVDLLRNDLGRISRARIGHLGGRLPGRALRDRLAADHDRLGRARAERSGSPTSSAGCSRADRSRARRRSARWRSSASSRTRLEGSTAGRSATWRRRAPAETERPLQRRDPHGHGGHRLHDRRVRGRRRDHVGLRRAGASTRRPSRSPACSPRAAPDSSSWRRCASIRRRAFATSTDTSSASPGLRRVLRLPSRRDRRPRGRREDRRLGAGRDGAPAPLAPQGRHGAGDGHAAHGRPRHGPRGDRRRRPGSERRLPVPQDVPARDRYEEARRRHPDADDVLLVNDRGEITESTIANVAGAHRRTMAHAAARGGAARGDRARRRTRGRACGRGNGDDRRRASGGGARADQRRSRVASRRPGLVALRLRAGTRTGASRTPPTGNHTADTGRLLVHEHGPLAVRAFPFSHRGRLVCSVRHRLALRGERSSPPSARTPAYLESGRCRDGIGSGRTTTLPGWEGSPIDPRRGAPYAASISLRLRRLPRAT